jgi:integrase/recombinase XerD
MTLMLYRRPKKTCPNFGKRRNGKQSKCQCKIWADGIIEGREVRMSLDLRDWSKAERIKIRMEDGEPTEHAATITLAHAWTSLLADLEARKLSNQTIRKYKLLKRQMEAYATDRGLVRLPQFDLDVLSRFRATWKDGPRTAAKKLERLRAFFRFAHDRQWVETNPATRIKLPKVSTRPTMPLTHDELVKILTACDGLQATTPIEGKLNAHRLKTLILLMRYTGMRVSDAVLLTTDRLDGKRLFLYTQKTGVPVYTVLPDSVLLALEATPRVTDTRYFWSGNGKRESVVCHWQMRLKKVFDLAGISKGLGNAVSHRLRDTFAVELLLAGVPIERVSILLGHQSVRITEKHYSPWVRARQEQLEADVASAWERDPVLNQSGAGTISVQSAKGSVN